LKNKKERFLSFFEEPLPAPAHYPSPGTIAIVQLGIALIYALKFRQRLPDWPLGQSFSIYLATNMDR
jgi:hypothetical protein